MLYTSYKHFVLAVSHSLYFKKAVYSLFWQFWSNYCILFFPQDIDGKKFLTLTKEQIVNLTGMKVGPSLKVYDLIQMLKAKITEQKTEATTNNPSKYTSWIHPIVFEKNGIKILKLSVGVLIDLTLVGSLTVFIPPRYYHITTDCFACSLTPFSYALWTPIID